MERSPLEILKRIKIFQSKKKEDANILAKKKNILSNTTLGFKTKITHNTLKGQRQHIKIFYENLEQYNFLINKLKN